MHGTSTRRLTQLQQCHIDAKLHTRTKYALKTLLAPTIPFTYKELDYYALELEQQVFCSIFCKKKKKKGVLTSKFRLLPFVLKE